MSTFENEDIQQVLIGSLLGDGYIYIKPKCQNACFGENHSIKQIDYLNWKAGVLSFFGAKISHGVDRVFDKEFKKVCLQTRVHPILTELRSLWYPNGKKLIPSGELQKLDSLGLAVWYQDDGSYNYNTRRCVLHTEGFNGQELAIQRWFKEEWGVSPYITSGHCLLFSVKDSDKFLRLIAEHVHPSMIYKLGHIHPTNQARIKEGREKRNLYERKYREKNKDKIKRSHSKYREKNRDKIQQRNREYWQKRGRFLQAIRRTHKSDNGTSTVDGSMTGCEY